MGLEREYQSNIYAAAIPDIYKCFDDISKINTDFNQLMEHVEFDDSCANYKLNALALTEWTSQIVKFAISCYNGNHRISMERLFNNATSDEYFNAIIQIMKIKIKRAKLVI